MRDLQALVAPEPPKGVSVRSHAVRVINKLGPPNHQDGKLDSD